ncbi:MAG: DUF554 domain-containing protein [Verrucomicrobiota bacterium]|nr:DUF554 domain-containing protein [Verrucomicrobiota bacterium]
MIEWFKIEWLPLGTFFNVFCILAGGTIGLILSRQLPDETQRRIRKYLAGLTVLAGGYMIANGLCGGWKEVNGIWNFLLLGLITLLAVSFGNLFGTWLKLQERLDKLGKEAKQRLTKSDEDDGNKFSDGFVTCTVLFTVGPMSILGCVEDGLGNIPTILIVKSIMDGIATMCFAPRFGIGVMLSAVPLLAYQGTVTLLASHLEFMKNEPMLLANFNLVGGLLVLTIVLVILEIEKVPLANYLPALVVGPALTWWWIL